MANPKGQGRGPAKNSPRVLQGIEREAQAVALRIAGRTMAEIGEALGYATKGGAHKAIKRAMKRIGSPEVEEYRELMTARLEKIVATWWPMMITPVQRVDGQEIINQVDDRLKATDRILRAITDMRTLHGLDLAKVLGSTPEDPLFVAPGYTDVELTPEQVEALVALDPALQAKVIDQQGNEVEDDDE